MDGLTLARSVAEIQCLAGGKVEKIQQPEKDELLFVVHSCGKNERLLISASPENCRIQLTEARPASPVDAPIFLMLLRKYLLNARINSIRQPNSDRVVVVEFEALNELRDCTRFFLHCEIMGKHSNIILVDGNGRIVDAVRRVSPRTRRRLRHRSGLVRTSGAEWHHRRRCSSCCRRCRASTAMPRRMYFS